MCDTVVVIVVNDELQRPPSLNLQTRGNTLAFLTLLCLIFNEVFPIGGYEYGGKSVNTYLVGIFVKLNGTGKVVSLSDVACESAERWCFVLTLYKEALDADYCRVG